MSPFPLGRLVITGGAGFLGWHLCHGLYRQWDILLFDRATFTASDMPSGVRVLRADIRDRAALRGALRGAGAVIHAAAALPLRKPEEIRSVNAQGTQAVLEVAGEEQVARVIHVSSTAVYGLPKIHPITEDAELQGVGAYGASKVLAERQCERARNRGQIVTVVRPKTFLGRERLGVFQIFFEWVRQGRRIPVIGDGSNRFQLLAVEDLVDAIRLLIELPAGQANDTFNVGAVEFGTVAADLQALFQHAATGSRLLRTPAGAVKAALSAFELLHLSPLYKWIYAGADQDSWVSTERLQRLGWAPRFSNVQTLIRNYDWYLERHAVLGAPGKGHRAPWREGVLGLFRRFL